MQPEEVVRSLTQVQNLVAALEGNNLRNTGLDNYLNTVKQLLAVFKQVSIEDAKIGRSGGIPGNIPASQGSRPVPQATPAQNTQRSETRVNQQVSVSVKGGIIDAETTRSITDIVRRELRRGTTQVA